ncbi:hypothetical protein TRFO_01735 [Tritrichomonas foetus]|uniref:Uncharacterized protein n=1 Tax=Tritrichomonas foetus TaxID=1144522 RepID=A0A1J4JPV3_9EUKA|nr:hypothetical protein TRFO_01735 [Tritrichomonas foetus]|eukprot:OHT01137.1 hypothetical protein TRFO_01735 [Tritrichomonas foetus]
MRKSRNEYDADDVRDIVESLISGMSLARVPDELHTQLLMPLSAAKNEAIVAGNSSAVKRIQSIMRELRLNPGKRNGGSSRASSRPQSAFVTSRAMNDKIGNLDVTIDELLEGRSLDTVESSLISRLIPAMKNRKQGLIANGDYHGSQLLENLIQEANSKHYEATYQNVQSTKLNNLKLQLLQAKADLEAAENFWKESKEQQENDFNESLALLEEQQAQQLIDYDNSFPENLPANFRKLSCHVLQLREQEKHLVLSKRYEDAIPFRERADKLEAKELEQQRQKFIRAFNTQREQLLETHASQKRCFERNWERKWERFNKEKEHEISVLHKTIANFERKIGMLENETDFVTAPSTPRHTPRVSSRQSTMNRAPMRTTPANMNARVRNIAASRMTQKKPVIRRVPSAREQVY